MLSRRGFPRAFVYRCGIALAGVGYLRVDPVMGIGGSLRRPRAGSMLRTSTRSVTLGCDYKNVNVVHTS